MNRGMIAGFGLNQFIPEASVGILDSGKEGWVPQVSTVAPGKIALGTRAYNFNAQSAVNIGAPLLIGEASPLNGGNIGGIEIASTLTTNSVGNPSYYGLNLADTATFNTNNPGNLAMIRVASQWNLNKFSNFNNFAGLVFTPTVTTGVSGVPLSFGGIDCTPTVAGSGVRAGGLMAGLLCSPITNATSAISLMFGVQIGHYLHNAGSGAITTYVGLDIGVQGALPTATTTWGIRVASVNSYFNGQTAFGGTATPANTIDIQSGVINGALDTMVYATPLALTTTAGQIHKVTTTSVVGNATINASSGGTAGQWMWIIVTNDASGARTITFGTNFKPSATLVGTISKTATISFISDGTSWWEHGRTTGL